MERSCEYISLHYEPSTSQERHKKTLYELWFGHSPTLKYFRIFGSKCYIKRDDDIGKFYARSDEGIFLGYSTRSKAYKCLNINTNKVVESANVRIDEFAERNEAESTQEPKIYRSFIFLDENEIPCCLRSQRISCMRF